MLLSGDAAEVGTSGREVGLSGHEVGPLGPKWALQGVSWSFFRPEGPAAGPEGLPFQTLRTPSGPEGPVFGPLEPPSAPEGREREGARIARNRRDRAGIAL